MNWSGKLIRDRIRGQLMGKFSIKLGRVCHDLVENDKFRPGLCLARNVTTPTPPTNLETR